MTDMTGDVSDLPGGRLPINEGESSFDVVLDNISDLGTDTKFIKHWHVAPLPEDDLSELVITFVDICDGTIDTAL